MTASDGPIRVLLAEDMRILADTLAAVLSLEDDIDVVARVSDGTAVVPAAVRVQPDVAVVDIDMPGTDGLTAAAALREQCPRCRVLILTMLGSPGNLRRALAAGVAGFLPKETPAGELADAVRTVAAGGKVISHKLAMATLEAPENPLSPREAEALRRFSAGDGPEEIAAAMVLSYGTVRNYLAAAVTKLDARNRTDAARIATEAGWLLASPGTVRPRATARLRPTRRRGAIPGRHLEGPVPAIGHRLDDVEQVLCPCARPAADPDDGVELIEPRAGPRLRGLTPRRVMYRNNVVPDGPACDVARGARHGSDLHLRLEGGVPVFGDVGH
ncbi:MAG TPA: response regulator transcription factor [Trebonia sp.]|nr:response regulator transcription factor [Trebonia sp.]